MPDDLNDLARRRLTDAELLDWIEAFLAEHRYAPSMDEVAAACGYTSKSTVKVRLARLQREGRITAVAGSPRTLVVVR